MSEIIDEDLYQRTLVLLEPGDIELVGAIIHTDLTSREDLKTQELTAEINDVIAEYAGKDDAWIHAGNDDTDFSSNQFQGLSVEDDEFVWERQQLVRDGTFDLVFYYETIADQDAIAEGLEALDGVDRITPVP